MILIGARSKAVYNITRRIRGNRVNRVFTTVKSLTVCEQIKLQSDMECRLDGYLPALSDTCKKCNRKSNVAKVCRFKVNVSKSKNSVIIQ